MPHEALIAELCERYDVGTGYVAAYLEFWLQPDSRQAGKVFNTVADILALPAPDSTWFDYALSTNRRGRALAAFACDQFQMPATPQRFLDIGCGFGGLLAAFAERGLDVRGIEPDPLRVRLAEANCRDHGLTDVVSEGDILNDELVAALGTFDIIAMIDVIEHVLDVPKALRHAAALLSPGGVLLLEIPNRHSLNFIAADGHFSTFGITLLERRDAMAYHQALFGTSYDVGDYYELADYERQFDALNCDISQVGSPHHAPQPINRVPALVTTVQRSLENYEATVAPQLTSRVQTNLQVRLAAYLSRLTADLAAARNGSEHEFVNRYLIDFWTVVAKKRNT